MAKLIMAQSVGMGGVNTPNDVKAVQGALNNLLGLHHPQENLLKTVDWVLVQSIQKQSQRLRYFRVNLLAWFVLTEKSM
jgi:hypothetical protein